MIVDFRDEILIPKGDVGDFAVVACDQFAAAPEYWAALAAELPPLSALDVILPECYLDEKVERIARIKAAAAAMRECDRFAKHNGCVYVTRTTKYGRVRHGVVASVDLDCYDYKRGEKPLIRASERTIESRIPPRVEIREALDIELPHILLLVDDREDLLMNAARASNRTQLYDGELKGGGGHIKGELIQDPALLDAAVASIVEDCSKKYGERIFALVGDGNHSLATAKYCCTASRTAENSRALVEIVNVYDPGLVFEPIHRIVKTDAAAELAGLLEGIGGDAETALYVDGERRTLRLPSDAVRAIERVDAVCEEFVASRGGYIEYVHGDAALRRDGYVGIEMRGIEKAELFGYVLENGVLPKKTFSLGEAEEKRYYVEARRIK